MFGAGFAKGHIPRPLGMAAPPQACRTLTEVLQSRWLPVACLPAARLRDPLHLPHAARHPPPARLSTCHTPPATSRLLLPARPSVRSTARPQLTPCAAGLHVVLADAGHVRPVGVGEPSAVDARPPARSWLHVSTSVFTGRLRCPNALAMGHFMWKFDPIGCNENMCNTAVIWPSSEVYLLATTGAVRAPYDRTPCGSLRNRPLSEHATRMLSKPTHIRLYRCSYHTVGGGGAAASRDNAVRPHAG